MENISKFLDIFGLDFQVKFSSEIISRRINDIANLINCDYADKNPVFLIVLKGAIFFASDLLRKIKLDCRIETVSANAYNKDFPDIFSNIYFSNPDCFYDADIIIIDDILESGKTLHKVLENLKKFEPKSIEIAVLLCKPKDIIYDIKPKYIGFEAGSEMLLGYGMDYYGRGSHLPEIYLFN